MERQITFKPLPGSSRNGQHDIYFHVKYNSLLLFLLLLLLLMLYNATYNYNCTCVGGYR